MSLRGSIKKQVTVSAPWLRTPDALRLEGSVLIKEVTAGNDSILVEGDLLWRAFESETEESVWEGAEYFNEELTIADLRGDDPFKLEPRVTDITMSEITDEGCALNFDVCWLETEDDSAAVTVRSPLVELTQPVATVRSEGEAELIEEPAESLEDRLAAAEAVWKEKWEALQNAVQNIPAQPVAAPAAPPAEMAMTETAAELSPPPRENESKSPPYRLKYYRVQAGEDLNAIAERLSASVMKIREINALHADNTEEGSMIRLP